MLNSWCTTDSTNRVDQRIASHSRSIPNGKFSTYENHRQFHIRAIPNWLNPQTSANGNITTSDIVYLPTPEDNGKVIACSVPVEEKINAPTLSIKDTRILDIKREHPFQPSTPFQINYLAIFSSSDAPIVTLSLGSNLDPKNLVKGTDVYLECRIQANPPIKKIEWYHNNKPLHSSRGIIITNQSLVLQSISKHTHGQYMCRAANVQGSVSSNDLYLDIKCKLIVNIDDCWCKSFKFLIDKRLIYCCKGVDCLLLNFQFNKLREAKASWNFQSFVCLLNYRRLAICCHHKHSLL